jgi:hypothetical protein
LPSGKLCFACLTAVKKKEAQAKLLPFLCAGHVLFAFRVSLFLFLCAFIFSEASRQAS